MRQSFNSTCLREQSLHQEWALWKFDMQSYQRAHFSCLMDTVCAAWSSTFALIVIRFASQFISSFLIGAQSQTSHALLWHHIRCSLEIQFTSLILLKVENLIADMELLRLTDIAPCLQKLVSWKILAAT